MAIPTGSGFLIDGETISCGPLTKNWRRPMLGRHGTFEPVQSGVWAVDLSFGLLESDGGITTLEEAYQADGLHVVDLPHPRTGLMTTFSGVAIDDLSHTFNEFDSDGWNQDVRLSLSGIVVQEAL